VTHLSPTALADLRGKKLGFIFQGFNLLPRMDALENVMLPMIYGGVPAKIRQQRGQVALEAVGLTSRMHHRPMEMSGGQQQRVAIARALAMEPKIMLFDEPTSALDAEMIREVLDVMRKLATEGMTMLVITHEVGFAREASNRVVFMDEGRIIEDSPTAEFFEHPREERAKQFLSKVIKH
jgi:ABC-type polar amino acid transport system ATPase subunit